MNLEIYNETKIPIPKYDFENLKKEILGDDFELQISILKSKNSEKINKKQRKQNYVPNTLSFKYSQKSGEIILTPEVIDSEDYEVAGKIISSFSEKFLYLSIHSMLHLTNLDHSSKMEKLEDKYFKKYSK
jgi:rRNA maturation RNase YbeY